MTVAHFNHSLQVSRQSLWCCERIKYVQFNLMHCVSIVIPIEWAAQAVCCFSESPLDVQVYHIWSPCSMIHKVAAVATSTSTRRPPTIWIYLELSYSQPMCFSSVFWIVLNKVAVKCSLLLVVCIRVHNQAMIDLHDLLVIRLRHRASTCALHLYFLWMQHALTQCDPRYPQDERWRVHVVRLGWLGRDRVVLQLRAPCIRHGLASSYLRHNLAGSWSCPRFPYSLPSAVVLHHCRLRCLGPFSSPAWFRCIPFWIHMKRDLIANWTIFSKQSYRSREIVSWIVQSSHT